MKKPVSRKPEMEFFSFPPQAAREGSLSFYLNGVEPKSVSGKIITAVIEEDSKKLQKLLADKSSLPDVGNIFGLTPLMMASARGFDEGVELILSHPLCNPDRTTIEGWTALHFAAEMKQSNAARILLSRYAARDIKNIEGHTALDLARGKSCETFFDPNYRHDPAAAEFKPTDAVKAIAVLMDAAREGSVEKYAAAFNRISRTHLCDPFVLDVLQKNALCAAINNDANPALIAYLVKTGAKPKALWDSSDSKKYIFEDPFAMKKYHIKKSCLHEAFTKVRGGALREMVLWSDGVLDADTETYYRRKAQSLLFDQLAEKTDKSDPDFQKRERDIKDLIFAVKLSEIKKLVKGNALKTLTEKFNTAVWTEDHASMMAIFVESGQSRFFRDAFVLPKDRLEKAAEILRKDGFTTAASAMEATVKKPPQNPYPINYWPPM